MKTADHFLQRALIWCYHLLFLVTPLLFTWFNEELFEFNKMLFVYLMALLTGGLWLGRMALHRQLRWRRTWFDLPLGLFLLAQILATIFSIHPWTSLFGYYTRFHGGLLSTLAYLTLFTAFIQAFPRSHIWNLLRTLAISSLLVTAVAIPEHFGRSFSCVLITTSQLAESQPLSRLLTPSQLWASYNTECWIQDVQTRVFATFGQPNWLAAYAITLLPLFSILAARRQSPRQRWLYGLTTLALLATLLFTRSRSGILGLALGAAWFGVWAGGWYFQRQHWRWSWSAARRWLQSARAPISIWGTLLVLSLAIILWFGTPYTPALPQIWQPRPTPITATAAAPSPAVPVNRLEEGGTDSGEIRKIVWTGALDVWRRFPLLGSGVETFAYSYYRDRPLAHNLVSEWDFLYNKAHNEWLNVLATTGLVGLVSYLILVLVMIGSPLWLAYRRQLSGHQVAILLAISAGLVALTISNSLGFSTVMVSVLFFLLPACGWKLSQSPTVPAPTAAAISPATAGRRGAVKTASGENRASAAEETLDPLHLVWPIIIGIAVVLGSLAVWRLWRADFLLAQGKRLVQSQELSEGLANLEEAARLNPNEGVFVEELGNTYSWISAAFHDNQQATPAAYYRELALAQADRLLQLNPHHLNFYKSRTRILATLAPQDPALLMAAEATLLQAIERAPTDPKLRYNLGVIRLGLGRRDAAKADLTQAITMKPNYEEARLSYAAVLLEDQNWSEAQVQYAYILAKIQPANQEAQAGLAEAERRLATASAKAKPNGR